MNTIELKTVLGVIYNISIIKKAKIVVKFARKSAEPGFFHALSKNEVSYSGGGSGKGIASISAKNGDFGGSDEPLTQEVLKEKNLVQFPAVIGAVVLGYNLDGIKDLRLDSSTLAMIYSGEITKWDDMKIKALNPSIKLPNADIIVIVRSDASGTTFNFTNYLANDEKWKQLTVKNKKI